MANPSDSFLSGANIDFIEAQYARFLEDPASVEPSWQAYFQGLQRDGRPLITDGLTLPRPILTRGNGHGPALPPPPAELASMRLQSKVDQTVFTYRLRGHLRAELDPLGVPRPPLDHVADIGLVSPAHFNDAEREALVDPQAAFDEPRVKVKDLLERMRRTYAHHIGVEYVHMYDSERRRWLMRRMEHCDNSTPFTQEERRRILVKLSEAELFEHTIHTKFQAAKRFSIEGGDALVPMLDALLEYGGSLGLREVVVGMAHRGRLNVLCNILGKPAEEIFSEFAGPRDPSLFLNRGDVKYHMGFSSDWNTEAGQKMHLSMAFNPSHLGIVHPVIEGRVRAKQDRVGGGPAARHAVLPLAIHGDAAFSGQGLVAETLNLSGLPAYDTGGTVHVVINNQVGYTTQADQGRTPLYCTGQAEMLDIPVFHVNGNDAEACVHVMRLAIEYRQRYQTDVVIDLVCYRKYGHNEGDEPRFTQPKMYERIAQQKTPRKLYAEQLVAQGHFTLEETDAIAEACKARFLEAYTQSKESRKVKDPSALMERWSTYRGGADADTPQVDTGVPKPQLVELLSRLATVPKGFTLHPNVLRGVLQKRQRMVRGEEPLDWGAGEMLAWASLVAQGYRIRLTGQDTERGTFAHRHAVLHDMTTGNEAFPIDDLAAGQARAVITNSPLSEMACLAFEYGYSLDSPDMVVAWEAQFGDFVNNAQVVLDQFIVASEDKWRRLTGLTLLLPHGYEGAGPEHSSARLERFLDLCAEDNIQVCYPTSPAQMFHLLRRQVVRSIRKPLVVLTPKSLMRLADAASPLDELTSGTYRRLIQDETPADPQGVTRLLLCSGKIYFELVKARDAAKDGTIAIDRLEQLYPLPEVELSAALARFPKLTELCWVQEEPRNSGAWRFLMEHLMRLSALHPARPALKYVGRPESASPATGYSTTHKYEQQLLITEATTRGQNVR